MQQRAINVLVDENTNVFKFGATYGIFNEGAEPAALSIEEAAKVYFEKRVRVPDEFAEIKQIFAVFI